MRKIKEFIIKNGIYILISFCLFFGLSSLIFRNATLDDDLYLWETSIMTETLSRGEWIGDYAVGTHGFLFKLPVAIVFLITGPSLEIATIWNVILACISLYIFYKILKRYFSRESIALSGTFLLLTSFQFFLHVPTYMREIPVLFSFLLFLYLLQNKKSYWLIGLSLGLIFDAKEYVLFMLLPGLIIYIFLTEKDNNILISIKRYLLSISKVLLPTLIIIVLMIFTRIVPINMYGLSLIPGVAKGGIEYHIKHFDVEVSTTNRIEQGAPSIQEDISQEDSIFERVVDIFQSYIGKLLYPRTFSFISVPKVIIFPALLSSIFLFMRKIKKRDNFYLAMFLLFWSFMSIFLLRASFDRYILPILPAIFFFYIFFLKEVIKEKKKFLITILVSGLLAFGGMFFEVDYILIKIMLNLLILGVYTLYYLYPNRIANPLVYISSIVGGLSLSIVLFFFYSNGQLNYYLNWGKDFEIKKVVSQFEYQEKILLNDVGWDILPKVYRGDNQYPPEWKMELADWVPRKKFLKTFEQSTTFGMFGKNILAIQQFVYAQGIQKIGLIVSNLEVYNFPYQGILEELKSQPWLQFTEKISLKNKTLYIFEVNR